MTIEASGAEVTHLQRWNLTTAHDLIIQRLKSCLFFTKTCTCLLEDAELALVQCLNGLTAVDAQVLFLEIACVLAVVLGRFWERRHHFWSGLNLVRLTVSIQSFIGLDTI
jgi:hypothetical protein